MASKKRRQQAAAGPNESPASVAVTVAWMMAVITTLICASVSAGLWMIFQGRTDNPSALVFVGLLHFGSIVTGAVSLLLLPVVLKIHRQRPPVGLVVFAAIVGALPIAALLLN